MWERDSSLSDMLFGFFDDEETLPESCREEEEEEEEEEEAGDDKCSGKAEDRKAFWDSQRKILQVALSWRSSLETKVCPATENALKRIRLESGRCSCPSTASGSCGGKECRKCMLRDISDELRIDGYDCGLCESKWRRSPGIPPGEHSYLDIVANKSKKTSNSKPPSRVVIELYFQAEFEMARASREYKDLVGNLPEVFVGNPKKLREVIKIVCTAAKRCMKENNMHMGPWRKRKYMQSKWLGSSSERVAMEKPEMMVVVESGRDEDHLRLSNRPRTSLLTSALHCTAVN